MTWLRSVERLSSSGPSAVADAHLHLRELAGLARALSPLALRQHACGIAACPFVGHAEATALCALVRRLDALDVVPVPHEDLGPATAARAFVEAVEDAGDTVRWCRQTAHPGGACWFGSSPGGDCGDVLKLAYRLG